MSNRNPTFLLSSHPSRLYFPSHLFPTRLILSLLRFPLYHQLGPRETLWLSSRCSLSTSFPFKSARLSRILLPMIYSAVLEEKRARSPIGCPLSTYFYPSLASVCLSHRQNHLSLLLIMSDVVEDGNKAARCRRRFDIMRASDVTYSQTRLLKEKLKIFNKNHVKSIIVYIFELNDETKIDTILMIFNL